MLAHGLHVLGMRPPGGPHNQPMRVPPRTSAPQRAMAAAQEEAAAAVALANEARAQARARAESRQEAAPGLPSDASAGALSDGGARDAELLAVRLQAQQAELERLEEELGAANARRAELSQVGA
jgi:hypothetical protein